MPVPGTATSAKDNFQTQLSDFLAAERQTESGGNYNAYNAAGGASGAYQFINSTWADWANQSGNSQYANGPASAAPAGVQDAAAAAMATSYYNKFGGNWQDVAESWYYPAWAGNAAFQNSVPYPSAGNTLTIGQYGSKVVDAMNQLLGNPQGPQGALNAGGQAQIGAAGAQAGAQAAGAAAGAAATQGGFQVTQQQLQNQLQDALAQLGISGQQLNLQQTGLGQQQAYQKGSYGLQQQSLAEQLQNLTAGYGFTQQQLGLQGTEIGQQHQQAEQQAKSGLAASGVYNTGTYGQTLTPIEQQYQNAMAQLGIQRGQAGQEFGYQKEQLANQKTQQGLTNTYQTQQLNNALAQLGLSRQGLALQGTEAQQNYQTGNESAYNSMLSQLAGLTQQYGVIFPQEAGQAGNILSGLVGVGQSGAFPGTGG